MSDQFKKANHKIEDTVVSGYRKIENTVVGGYHKLENGVVDGFTKMTDAFVSRCLTHEGETVEEAKARLKVEEADREKAQQQALEDQFIQRQSKVGSIMELERKIPSYTGAVGSKIGKSTAEYGAKLGRNVGTITMIHSEEKTEKPSRQKTNAEEK